MMVSVTNTPSKQTRMNEIPPEILEKIFSYIDSVEGEIGVPSPSYEYPVSRYLKDVDFIEDEDGVPFPSYVNLASSYWMGGAQIRESIDENQRNSLQTVEEHPPFKSFRLVSRLWYRLSTPFMFEKVTLLCHPDSWKNFENISLASHLGKHVRTIRLATIMHLRPFDTMEDWAISVRVSLDKSHSWTPAFIDHLSGSKAYITAYNDGSSTKTSEFGQVNFQRYEYWSEGERKMREHRSTGTSPALPLQLLPSLHNVESVGHDELAIVKKPFKYKYRLEFENRHTSTRREYETLVEDFPSDFADVDSCHLELFLRALRNSGSPLITMTLRNDKELVFPRASDTIECLRCLELNLGDGMHETYYHTVGHIYWTLGWIQKLVNLEELTITVARSVSMTANIFVLLCEMHFPRLRKLKLKDTVMRSATLTIFLNRHREQLRHLHIEKPRMPLEEWEWFFNVAKLRSWKASGRYLYIENIHGEEVEI